MKLNLGCGEDFLEGFVGVDIIIQSRDDVQWAELWDLPYPDNSVEEIRCVHALEHIERKMVGPTLAEWHRVLMAHGLLVVEVPDIDYVCKFWCEGTDPEWGLEMLFGLQDHAGGFHKTGFTMSSLATALLKVGFETPSIERVWSHAQYSLRAKTIRG